LRANLALAIAYCAEWKDNNYEFGKLNVVTPLVSYMNSKNKDVLKGSCIAIYHLSKEPLNCITMHTCGVIKVASVILLYDMKIDIKKAQFYKIKLLQVRKRLLTRDY